MSLRSELDLIKNTLEAGLPSLLSGASLSNFDEYRTKSPSEREKKSICVYLDNTLDNTLLFTRSFIIQVQLFRIDDDEAIDYYDVITPFIKENITPELLGYVDRDKIEDDYYPIDGNTSTSFIFYSLTFNTDLDDCED